MTYSTEIQFLSAFSTNGYQGSISFEMFCKLADSQFTDYDIPDYGAMNTHNCVKYSATNGSMRISYQESTLIGSWWEVNTSEHGGGGITLSAALTEYYDFIRESQILKARQAEEYFED